MKHELAVVYGKPSIQKECEAGRIRWAAHFARIPNNNLAKMVCANDLVCTKSC